MIAIYEGEQKKVSKNHKLGEFFISGIQPMKAGKALMDVTIKIDESGILYVEAKDLT